MYSTRLYSAQCYRFKLNISSGSLCSQESVFNFTSSNSLGTSRPAVCLACLFNGEGPQSGTMWFIGTLDLTNTSFSQVNNNGTLIITRPPGFTGQVIVTCQRGGNQFNITLIGELYIQCTTLSVVYKLLCICSCPVHLLLSTYHIIKSI